MPRHEYFDELCSLAAVGELSAAESEEFRTHLERCAECKSAYGEFSLLTNDHLPLADAANRDLNAQLAEATAARIRKNTLSQVANLGLHISPEAHLGRRSHIAKVGDWLSVIGCSLRERWLQVVLATSFAIIIVLGFVLTQQSRMNRHTVEQLQLRFTKQEQSTKAEPASPILPTRGETARSIEPLKRELDLANRSLNKLTAEHEDDLAVIASMKFEIEQLKREKLAFTENSEAAQLKLATLADQLNQAKAAVSDKDAEMVAQQYQIAQLTSELRTQKTALDKQQELLAMGRDVRDFMTARNLHIIDVHDQDARGESHPFGRIFLTEGKSLVFYAYDLDEVRVKNASFQAWGQRTDSPKSAVSLGIFYVDDQKQSRWALKVDDANLLKTIDSVFVTVEPSGGNAKPSGKKLMYAYLRNPINHP